MKTELKKIRKHLEKCTENMQKQFDEMTEEEHDKKIDFHEGACCIQCSVDELIDDIDMFLDNN